MLLQLPPCISLVVKAAAKQLGSGQGFQIGLLGRVCACACAGGTERGGP